MKHTTVTTWNCNMKLREKLQPLQELKSDIYIIQECEDPERVKYAGYSDVFSSHLWKGKNKSKGIGVFCTGSTTVEILDFDDSDLELFLPCKTNLGFNVLAVWTKDKSDIAPAYIGQFWAYYERHREYFRNDRWLILGDFNSNSIWDKRYKPSHSFVMSELENDNYFSAYHNNGKVKINHGSETEPTLYKYRHEEKPYHVDYVFSKSDSKLSIRNLQVGQYSKWGERSDHMPLSFEIEAS